MLISDTLTNIYNIMSTCNYFTIVDLLKSTTAERLKIDNQPSDEVREELEITVCRLNIISVIAHAYGATIRVTSGYRCRRLNAAVGGVSNSLHVQGRAVDFVVSDIEVKRKLHDALKEEACIKLLGICELIEYPSFIHVGFLRHSLE